MDRRTFLASATLGLLAAPLAAEAQQVGKTPRMGYLSAGSPRSRAGTMHSGGDYGNSATSRGRTSSSNTRFTDGSFDALPRLAADLLRLHAGTAALPAQ